MKTLIILAIFFCGCGVMGQTKDIELLYKNSHPTIGGHDLVDNHWVITDPDAGTWHYGDIFPFWLDTLPDPGQPNRKPDREDSFLIKHLRIHEVYIPSTHGEYYSEQEERQKHIWAHLPTPPKTDTIACIMLVCDTGYSARHLEVKPEWGATYWIKGFYTDQPHKTLEWHQWIYLDSDRKPLPKSIVVWMVK